MATAGPNYCGTATDNATVGTKVWSSVTNAQGTPDMNPASADSVAGASNVVDFSVRMIKAGVLVGSNLSSGALWTVNSYNLDSFGGPTNLWGTTWTYTDINNSNFGVALAAQYSSDSSITHYLWCTNFGFSLPASTINGIQVECVRACSQITLTTLSFQEASFVAGTMIQTQHGALPIEKINVGDLVHCFDKYQNNYLARVTHLKNRVTDELISINKNIITTPSHKFLTKNGFVEAGKLKPRDVLWKYNNNNWVSEKVDTIQKITSRAPVYNFEVENQHTYFANEYAVHNLQVDQNPTNAFIDSVRITVTYTLNAGKVKKSH